MSLKTIYKWPTLIAIASLIGLLSALLADGVWDWLSWITLGGTAGVGSWYALRRRASFIQDRAAMDGGPGQDSRA